MTVRGMLDAGELDESIDAGAIDTVLVAFPDLQGRLVGKRVTRLVLARPHGRGHRGRCTCATTSSRSTSR